MTTKVPGRSLRLASPAAVVRDDLARVVRTALEPAQLSVWISERG